MKRTLTTLAILATLTFGACASKVEPQQVSQVVAVEVNQARHRCGAPTKAHKPCQQWVSAERNNCYRHAITDSDVEYYEQVKEDRKHRNPCWRPAGSAPVEDCYYQDGDVTRPITGKP